MMKTHAIVVLLLAVPVVAADGKDVLNPLRLAVDQEGKFPPRGHEREYRGGEYFGGTTAGGVIYRQTEYRVARVLGPSAVALVVSQQHRKSQRWVPVRGFFVLEGRDTSKMADGQEVDLAGKYRVSGTRRLEESGETLFVVEKVKD